MSDWSSAPNVWSAPTPTNPWDALSQDEVLLKWDDLKKDLAKVKADEMEMRKYVVKRGFPQAEEGTNTLELGNGYSLKAVITFNYKLIGTNEQIEEALDRISLICNEGSFIANKLITWTPNFHKSEYKDLQDAAKAGSQFATQIITEINKVLQIDDAAPKLEIKEPSKRKK